MTWANGKRELRTYTSIQEGKESFKSLWSRKYGWPLTLEMAQMYSGEEESPTWLREVNNNYQNG